MKRREFLVHGLALGTVALAGGAAQAADGFADNVAAQLRSQGYETITQERTLLGRVRITGRRGGGTREIILNPRTGEILRDLWVGSGGDDSRRIVADDGEGGKGRGRGRGGDDDRDDDKDDDRDDDKDDDKGGDSGGDGGGDSGSDDDGDDD